MKRFTASKPDPNASQHRTLTGKLDPGKNPEDETALLVVNGRSANAVLLDKWSSVFGPLDLGSLLMAVEESAERVKRGDLSDAEGLLIAQATSLNAVFADLLLRASGTKTLEHFDRYLRLGFKAQAQCRATLETLALAKNPPVFARQANIANGPQQINNGSVVNPNELARAENSKDSQIEVLETINERLDTRTPREAETGDKTLAAVGQINRTKNPYRKSARRTQCLSRLNARRGSPDR